MTKMTIPPDLIDWLLYHEPWVAYRTRLDLLGQAEAEPTVQAARAAMLAHPLVTGLVSELAAWPGPPVNSHKSAGQLLHKLAFLADLGLRADDPGMPPVVEAMLAHQSAQGPFQMLGNISPSYGGSGQDHVWLGAVRCADRDLQPGVLWPGGGSGCAARGKPPGGVGAREWLALRRLARVGQVARPG